MLLKFFICKIYTELFKAAGNQLTITDDYL